MESPEVLSSPVVVDWQMMVAVAVFVTAYVVIAWERLGIHKTIAALFGAAVVLVLGIVRWDEAAHGTEQVEGVDWNTIFLLVGMMIIVGITKETGIFQYLAIRAAKMARGRPIPLIILLSAVTALLSAFLDNVTTVLLIAPVTILLAESLEVDPVPFLVCEILASNIGGTATLVGDPPNIMIASTAKFSFLDFIVHLTPVALLIFGCYVGMVALFLRKRLRVAEEQRQVMMSFDERRSLTDKPLLVKCGVVLGITMVGFVVHGFLRLEPAVIALFGAALLLLISRRHPSKYLEEVEWPTIFFFMGLFIMVSALVKVGVISFLAHQLIAATHDKVPALAMLILWFSGFASAIVDNIPYVATMNPLILEVAQYTYPDVTNIADLSHLPGVEAIWWSLALGACLGGNGSVIGASANVVVVGIAEKSGYHISFVRFLKYGVGVTFMSLVISTVYIWLRYIMPHF
ncbi:MAG: SLC13 family permease [Armatimonadota bacterium]